MTYADIVHHREILEYYDRGNKILDILGYTDHSTVHTKLVAERAEDILHAFGYGQDLIELAKIAGFMHDIGNAINRHHHAEYGALLANEILKETDLSLKDRVHIVSAIANHDESYGVASDPVSAALIIADKTDVRRTRVRSKDPMLFDVHDRVNYAVEVSKVHFSDDNKSIILELQIDTEISSVLEYFEIFMKRMLLCRRASEYLGVNFEMMINGSKIL